MPPVDELLKNSAFVVGYDKKGDPIDVVTGLGFNIIDPGSDHTISLIEKVKEHLDLKEGPGDHPIEVKSNNILHLGSKSCYIVRLATGKCIVVCG